MNPSVPSQKHGMLLVLNFLLSWLIAGMSSAAAPTAPPTQPTSVELTRVGDEHAIRYWRQEAAAGEQAGDRRKQVGALVNLSAIYQANGYQALAHETAQKADTLASSADLRSLAAAKNALGMVLLFQRAPEAAEHELTLALSAAVEAREDRLIAQVLNNVGNLEQSRQKFAEAAENYRSSATAAVRAGDVELQAKAQANLALALAHSDQASQALEAANEARTQLNLLPASRARNTLLLSVASFWEQQAADNGERTQTETAAELYQESFQSARELGDDRTTSYAAGYLGRLRARAGDTLQAEQLFLEAIRTARQTGLSDALFRWQWELARLKKASEAIAFYWQAIQTFQPLLTDWVMSVPNWQRSGSFRDEIGPMYFELADLLLRMAAEEPDPIKSQGLLRRTQETLELLKAGEFADYFQEPCVDRNGPTRQNLATVAAGTAVLYVVPLPDRTELLVDLGDRLYRFTAAVDETTLIATVREFRRKLEKRTTREYMITAQKLDEWLIQPAIDLLRTHQIRTLVWVPDGALRTVPPAAFHDGTDFLSARFALAVVPGLTLMDPQPLRQVPRRMLLSGLSESVQGFPSLDYVPNEVEAVHELFGGKVLLNQAFATARLESELDSHQYTLVHLASHAEFSSDLRKTGLLTHDGRISLTQLEESIRPCQYLGRPVELLALSACQTAAGDDRAALGLAGVALKAGARSALATLWFVNDQASASLVSEFYRQLHASPDISKAEALQAAQLHLLQDPRYQHPAYWAPYLMIGNWL